MLAWIEEGAVGLPALLSVGDPQALVASLGYLAVFLLVAGDGVVPIFPGETSIVVAAVFAANGDLNIWLVIVAGALGAVAGDSIAFWIGRGGGPWMRTRASRMVGEERMAVAEHMVHRQGDILVFTQRFITILRLAINIVLGAGTIAYRRYLAIDTAAAFLWAAQGALIGYLSGKIFPGETWLAVVVALVIAGILIGIIVLRERRRIVRERQMRDDGRAGAEET
ncbi:MAG: DedA family protein [Actinobacteria bacterium]|nr:DedA family protein [Actinomycetota bacterium]